MDVWEHVNFKIQFLENEFGDKFVRKYHVIGTLYHTCYDSILYCTFEVQLLINSLGWLGESRLLPYVVVVETYA